MEQRIHLQGLKFVYTPLDVSIQTSLDIHLYHYHASEHLETDPE